MHKQSFEKAEKFVLELIWKNWKRITFARATLLHEETLLHSNIFARVVLLIGTILWVELLQLNLPII